VSLDPHNLLAQVHPDLQSVLRAAAQTPQAFQVVYGIRTLAAEQAAVASGHSTTMHSRHLPQPGQHNLSCAVDVAALTNGHIDWNDKCYPAVAAQVKAAAAALHIPIEWGGDWRSFRDFGHFQLPWAQYP
jgi:peptidoglycan L-alanyl-D-glutamate endopeptidase CwlK